MYDATLPPITWHPRAWGDNVHLRPTAPLVSSINASPPGYGVLHLCLIERSDVMDVLQLGPSQQTALRRCHLWCWSPGPPAVWDRRTLVVGGLSPVGLVAVGISAAASVAGNRRRREDALRDAEPRWRYVGSGAGSVVDGRLVVREASGVERSFDLAEADRVESPAPGWLRVTVAGSSMPWAIQVM